MNGQNDGTIEFGFSYDAVKQGIPQMISLVDSAVAHVASSMETLNAFNAKQGPSGGFMGAINVGMDGLETGMGRAEAISSRLLGHLDRMSTMLTSGLGIGAAVGGFALLERTFTRSLEKAREFQTAQISIAAELSSIGKRTLDNGQTVSPAMGFQSNLRYAQDLQARLLRQSAENHLKFQEQLGAFQSALEPGVRKGLSVEQVFNVSNLGAMAAKSLGLRGEQIANSTRLLLGGGVNVARSTIGRALGIQNEDITSRSGDQLSDFLTQKLKGFQEAQGEFGQSIEGVISTLESRVDVMLSKVGMRFFDKIKPTLQGLFAGSEEPTFQTGAGHTNETKQQYDERVKVFEAASEKQNETVDSLAEGFTNVFTALKRIVDSGAFQEFTRFLAFAAQYTDKIVLAAVFFKIANALKSATVEGSAFANVLKGIATTSAAMEAASPGGGAGGSRGAWEAGASRTARMAGLAGVSDDLLPLLTPMRTAGFWESEDKRGLGEFLPAYPGAKSPMAPASERFAQSLLAQARAREEAELEYASWNVGGMSPYKTLSKDEMLEERFQGIAGITRENATPTARAMSSLKANVAKLGAQAAMFGANYVSGVMSRVAVGGLGVMGGMMLTDTAAQWGGTAHDVGMAGGGILTGGSLGYILNGRRGAMGGALAGLGMSLNANVENMQGDAGAYFGSSKGLASMGTGALTGAGVGFGLAGPLGAVGGALAGTILNPLISSMNQAAEAAKLAAHDMDDMRQRFPHGAEMSDLNEKYRISQKSIRDQVASGQMSGLWGSEQMASLNAWHAREADKINQSNQADKNFKGYFDNIQERIAGQTRINSDLEKYGNTFETERALISGKASLEHLNVMKENSLALTSESPIPYQEEQALREKIARERGSNQFAVTTKGAAGSAEADIRGEMLRKAEDQYREHRRNTLFAEINASESYQQRGLGLTQESRLFGGPLQETSKKVLDTLAGAMDEATKNVDHGKEIIQSSVDKLFDDIGMGIRDYNLKRESLGVEATKQGIAQKEYFHDLPFEKAKLAFEPEVRAEAQTRRQLEMADLDVADQEAALRDKEREEQKKELALRSQRLDLTIARREREFAYQQEDQPNELRKAQLDASNSEGAQALFFGGMGPVSKIAAAIRYKVEAEFAGRFNPAEYEAAYRQKLENELEGIQLTKEDAERKVQRLPQQFKDRNQDEADALAQDALDKQRIKDEQSGANLAELKAAQEAKDRAEKRREAKTNNSLFGIDQAETANYLERFNDQVTVTTLGFKLADDELRKTAEDLARSRKDLAGGLATLMGHGGDKAHAEPGNPLAAAKAAIDNHGRALTEAADKHHQAAAANMHKHSGTHTPAGHANESGGHGLTIPVTVNMDGKAAPDNQFTNGLKAVVKQCITEYCEAQSRRPS